MNNFLSKMAVVSAITVLSLTGYAGEFFEKDGSAIKGFDTVAYFTMQKAIKGIPAYTSVYKGSTFQFATGENRDLFAANPAKYAPQYNGYCAYGVSKGAKAKIEGDAFKIVEGKLYLNYDKSIQSDWEKGQAAFITKADKNWESVRKLTKVVQ